MLTFNESFSEQYIEALVITCKESKKTWEHFCKNVPMFNKNNGEKDIKIIAREVHKKYSDIIITSKIQYEKWWIEEKYDAINVLNKLFDLEFSKKITAYICITPLFTRNINHCSFLLPTNACKKRFYNIVVHELIHFFYYEKIEQMGFSMDNNIILDLCQVFRHFFLHNFFDCRI